MIASVSRRAMCLVCLFTFLALKTTIVCFGQSQVLFPAAASTPFPGNFGLQENAGLSAAGFGNYLVVWFRGDRGDQKGVTYHCGVYFPSDQNGVSIGGGDMFCPQDYIPASDGPGQIVVWNNQLWMAYAAAGTRQLVVCNGGIIWMNCTTVYSVYVADSPAIGVTPDGSELDIAYQENANDHFLGVVYTTDGVTFTNTLSSTYRIGHSPGMTTLDGKEYIVAFCQCDAHYLDVYTSTGQGQVSLLTEDQEITMANASPPSIVAANNVLVLGYIQNGSRYFQISTSYDGFNWTAPVRQSNLVSPWGGPALAVYNNSLWLFYNPQGTSLGPRQLAYTYTVLPQ